MKVSLPFNAFGVLLCISSSMASSMNHLRGAGRHFDDSNIFDRRSRDINVNNARNDTNIFDAIEPISKTSRRRRLVERDFVPLSCNEGIHEKTCVSWTEYFGTDSRDFPERAFISCGKCVYMDLDGELVLSKGLDIHGKLVFPESTSLTVHASVIIVQGHLVMTSTDTIGAEPRIKFVMTHSGETKFRPIMENKDICGTVKCVAGKKAIAVAGGQVNIVGMPSHVPAWVHLHDVFGGTESAPEAIIVEDNIYGTWGPGAEIVITSFTTDWMGDQVREIDYVDRIGGGKVRIGLDEPIIRPTTMMDAKEGEPHFAVEVGLLSRNIAFIGDGRDPVESHGGHFWVVHTPNVKQVIQGVEIENFGQQGSLGRYPIHFHFCGNMDGSLVAKNSIRNSNQRCIVVHGTDNLEINDNVSYNSKGHCFVLEDGIERYNKFIRNLAIRTMAPKTGIKAIPEANNGEESDTTMPSLFWITHPSNHWIGNVATGSSASGYWFDLKVRGLLADTDEYRRWRPNEQGLTAFVDNVAHSNKRVGIRTYPQHALRPKEGMDHFTGMKLYRHNFMGIFVHTAHHIVIENSVFADNGLGCDVDRTDDIILKDNLFIGMSETYRRQAEVNPLMQTESCYRDNKWGLEIHTYGRNEGVGGTSIDGARFKGFSDTYCRRTAAISVDPRTVSGRFYMYTSFKGIQFEDERGGYIFETGKFKDYKEYKELDFCRSKADGLDIHMADLDGMLSKLTPGSQRTANSAMVTNSAKMIQFIDASKRTDVPDECRSYIEDTCFRSVIYQVEPNGYRETLKLKVCQRSTTNCNYWEAHPVIEPGITSKSIYKFAAHLPPGRYDLGFVNKAMQQVRIPDIMEGQVQDVNYCGDSDDLDIRLGDETSMTTSSVFAGGTRN